MLSDQLKFDVRVRSRLLRKGQLKEEEVQKHLDALPDVGSSALPMDLNQPALAPAEVDDDFDDEDEDEDDDDAGSPA